MIHTTRGTPDTGFDKVDRSRFLDELQPLGEPFVVRGLADEWPAFDAARDQRALVERCAVLDGQPAYDERFAERLQLVEKPRSVDFVEFPYRACHGSGEVICSGAATTL